jgi:hypothetical protein
MKNMSYRDKMIILVISIVIILVAGFFALIKPAYDKLVSDQAVYESTKTEWDGIQQKLNAIPDLKDGIQKAYANAKKDAEVLENTAFGDINKDYDRKKVNYGLDQYIEQALDDNNLEITALAVGDAGDCDIEYSYYEPNVVTYALLESGDVNGNYAEEISKLIETGTIIEEKEMASIMANNVNMELEGTKPDLLNFLDTIIADKNAINVNEVTIDDYTFTDEEEENAAPAARPAANAEGEEEDKGGHSHMTINLNFYNAKTMDEPDLGD